VTIDAIEKAIEMYEAKATDFEVAEATGISPDEAKAGAEALQSGETERLVREIALAGTFESAAQILRSGRGLIGDTAADLVREIWHGYPNACIKVGDTDRKSTVHAGGVDQAETEEDRVS
jgi:hypothetical protein